MSHKQHFDEGGGNLHEMSPNDILEIMKKNDCDHFIWISKDVTEGDIVHLARVYAHELQHIIQKQQYPELDLVNHLIADYLGELGGMHAIDNPIELDAEIKAFEIITSTFNNEKLTAYYNSEKAVSQNAKNFYEKLEKLKLTIAEPVDIQVDTFILKHKLELQKLMQCPQYAKHQNRFNQYINVRNI